jgi:Raf kinase inhibitor-like YbhB/YbcL family protein
MIVTITSTAFQAGQPMPRRYTGEGEDASPPLAWNVPVGTKEIALICDDPDAPRADPWVHWLLYGLAGDVTGIPENLPKGQKKLTAPMQGAQGLNDFGRVGYGGPMPPRGHGVHHYHFKLYALNAPLNLMPGATKARLLEATKGKIMVEGRLIGTYERK